MTAATDHGRFVATARRHYIPARRWAKTTGWTKTTGWDTIQWQRHDCSVVVHLDIVWSPRAQADVARIVVDQAATPRREYYPATIAAAIDHLVTDEILPAELHSMRVEGVLDEIADRLGWRLAGLLPGQAAGPLDAYGAVYAPWPVTR